MEKYNRVYDFTNENVSCLNKIYNLNNSKILSVVGSGDQYFSSILNGAKQVDLFDINSTAYLYFVLKFYAIRELTYEEFYDFLVNKNIENTSIYFKLEPFLPKEVLKYYHYLIEKHRYLKNKKMCFRKDGVNLLTRDNKKYYFRSNNPVIPYLLERKYYELQKKLKNLKLPNFFKLDFLNLKKNNKYDVLLTSNILDYLNLDVFEYVKRLKTFDIPEIQVYYEWFDSNFKVFLDLGCSVSIVPPSAPHEYSKKGNYVYSLRKGK